MTGVRLFATVALVVGGQAAAGEASLYQESRGEAGTLVRVYSETNQTYSATIETPGKPAVHVAPRLSLPPPRLHWISPDLFQMDYGSELGADVTSLFYSVKRNAIDGPYEFVKVVDPITERILCTGLEVVVQWLFGGGGRVRVRPHDMARSAMTWFVVNSKSRFEGDKLYITYMLETFRPDDVRWVSRVIELPHPGRSERSGPQGQRAE